LDIAALQAHPIAVGDEDFERVVEHSPLPVLLEFWSPHCRYSRQMTPVIESLAPSTSDRLRIAKLNIDEHRRTSARYGVSATPTLVIFDRGREIDRVQGALTEEQLRYRLHKYLG
jgi:thioredoxin